MDSPLTSNFPSNLISIVFRDKNAAILEIPHEWETAWIEIVGVPSDNWDQVRLWLGERELEISPRKPSNFGAVSRLLAEWPRMGPGHYSVWGEVGGQLFRRDFTIWPRKITREDYEQLLNDLDEKLPASLAVSLQRLGGLAGVKLLPPSQTTLAQEFIRLQRAVHGVQSTASGDVSRPGLIKVLRELASDPHRVLHTTHPWTPAERARHPQLTSLLKTVARSDNLLRPQNSDARVHPRYVVDTRVEHTVDVYENRLVKVFHDLVQLRLRRLEKACERAKKQNTPNPLQKQIRQLQDELAQAHRAAIFLDEVSSPFHLTNHVTMVLLRRPPYRAALEGYIDLHHNITARLEEPRLESPLENLPLLYQVWGTLQILDVLLEEAAVQGYEVTPQSLFRRDSTGVFIELVPDGRPLVSLSHPIHLTKITLIPERTYKRKSPLTTGLHSVSFEQRPDVVIEVVRPNHPVRVFVFDPKYKLDSEWLQNNVSPETKELFLEEGDMNSVPLPTGRPKKVDIDKMHTYRDAIRGSQNEHVVEYAAILYPGQTEAYDDGLHALGATPKSQEELRSHLRTIFQRVLENPSVSRPVNSEA